MGVISYSKPSDASELKRRVVVCSCGLCVDGGASAGSMSRLGKMATARPRLRRLPV